MFNDPVGGAHCRGHGASSFILYCKRVL